MAPLPQTLDHAPQIFKHRIKRYLPKQDASRRAAVTKYGQASELCSYRRGGAGRAGPYILRAMNAAQIETPTGTRKGSISCVKVRGSEGSTL